ncbi:hypothetical protein HELRODRAFT_132066, partial [Helobdella robusta]|uniref:Cytochrome P450 n=1 Tax=Helobdella robusta TaxID=6412 RepID=T1EHX2_HELRO
ICFYLLKWFNNRKQPVNDSKLQLPPCLPRLPIVGSLFFIPNIKKLHIYFMEKSKEIGNVIAFYMCNRYVIILNGRKVIYEALVKHSLCFSSRDSFYLGQIFNPQQKGIALHPYNDHFKTHHRICLDILRQFGYGQGIMEFRIKTEIENLIERIKLKNGVAFDPSFELTASVSNIISSIIFGKPWKKDDPEFLEGIRLTHEIIRGTTKHATISFFPVLRFLPYYRKNFLNFCFISESWNRYLGKIIDKTKNCQELESFCSAYIEKMETMNKLDELSCANEVDEVQLKQTIADLFLGGTETTATTLLWFIYFMANNLGIQEQIRNELDIVVGTNKLPSLNDKLQLPITEATILELMRIRTLVPLAVPHLTIKESVIDGNFIPSNTVVFVNLYSANMDPDVWNEPEKFKIERFLNEDQTKVVNRDQMISFSLGKRSCLGEILARQELLLYVSSLIQHFEILPPEGD